MGPNTINGLPGYVDLQRVARCRLLFVWPDEGAWIEQLALQHQYLRRMIVIRGPGLAAGCFENPKISEWVVPVGVGIEASLSAVLEHDFVYLVEGKVDVIISAAQKKQHPQLALSIEKAVLAHMRSLLSVVALRATRGWHMLLNTLLNDERALREASVDDLRGRCAGLPAVIVGAGPSLDEAAAELRQFREKVFIIACDGAWSTLAKAGVVPDLVVAVDDSERIWRHCAGLGDRHAQVPVVCLLQTAWPVIRYHRGPLYFGSSPKVMDRILARELKAFPVLDTGLCVGHAALEVAELLGVSRVIMAGFDLCFAGERRHAAMHAVPYYDDNPPEQANGVMVEGNNGQSQASDQALLMYLREFERRIGGLTIPVINVARNGARIAGTQQADLAETLTAMPDIRRPIFAGGRSGGGMQGSPAEGAFRLAWRQAFLELAQKSKSFTGIPQLGRGPNPFALLSGCQEAVEVLTESGNAAMLADFRLAWEDWLAAGAPVNEVGHDVACRAAAVLSSFAHDGALFAAMLAFEPIAHAVQPMTVGRALVVRGMEVCPEEVWTRLLERWKEEGWLLQIWGGAADDVAGIWDIIHSQAINMVISLEGSVYPLIWAVPGCGCMDVRLQVPTGIPMREAWLPGYIAVTIEEPVAEAWRKVIPADCSVVQVF